MDASFYTGATGVFAQQNKLNVISNNIANFSTTAYKSKRMEFSDLLTQKVNAENHPNDIEHRVGVKGEKTDTDYGQGSLVETEQAHDFAIVGKGFFKVMRPQDGEARYTRDGNFRISKFEGDKFYLTDERGNIVVDEYDEVIEVSKEGKFNLPGIFEFSNEKGLSSEGENVFQETDRSGVATVTKGGSSLRKGYIETSNTDPGEEFSRLIEAQRAFQFALRMVKTSDEVEQVAHSLR